MPHPAPAHKSFTDRTSLYQEITDRIIAELEQGRLPWVQPWSGVAAPLGLPKNAATRRPYSGINILILWTAIAERGFCSQNWLTFRQALKLGAHVKKGERGTTVVYADRFIPYRERTARLRHVDGFPVLGLLRRLRLRFARSPVASAIRPLRRRQRGRVPKFHRRSSSALGADSTPCGFRHPGLAMRRSPMRS